MKKIFLSMVLMSLFGASVFAADCICTMQYEPVCGTDGKTYGNVCTLGCAGATFAYDGECGVKDEFLVDATIPLTCTRWYDGCNTCSVVNGVADTCTELACFTLNRPKCLEQTFVYLTATHQQFITQAINAYLDRASDRVSTAASLLVKVTTKREYINNILMVSTFPIGSKELKRYELLLEVLAHIDSILP